MRPLRLLFLLVLGIWSCSALLQAGEFHLNSGDVVRGEAVSFNDDGMVVRLEIGGYSPRISWSKLTQDTLKELLKNPEAAKFVEPFIDVPPVSKDKEKKKKDIVIKPVPRAEHLERTSFASFFTTPAGLMLLVVLLAANVYAAYQIALFRHRPPGLISGVSIILPVITPAIVFAMPSAPPPEMGAEGLAEPSAAQAAGKATTGPLAKAPMASGLSIAQEKPAATGGGGTAPQTFKRGEFTFNRRFMETKFPSFFRVVQNEADRDLVLAVRTGKTEHVGKRISRISSNEMHLQLLAAGKEVMVPFTEITEIQIRREAKA